MVKTYPNSKKLKLGARVKLGVWRGDSIRELRQRIRKNKSLLVKPAEPWILKTLLSLKEKSNETEQLKAQIKQQQIIIDDLQNKLDRTNNNLSRCEWDLRTDLSNLSCNFSNLRRETSEMDDKISGRTVNLSDRLGRLKNSIEDQFQECAEDMFILKSRINKMISTYINHSQLKPVQCPICLSDKTLFMKIHSPNGVDHSVCNDCFKLFPQSENIRCPLCRTDVELVYHEDTFSFIP